MSFIDSKSARRRREIETEPHDEINRDVIKGRRDVFGATAIGKSLEPPVYHISSEPLTPSLYETSIINHKGLVLRADERITRRLKTARTGIRSFFVVS